MSEELSSNDIDGYVTIARELFYSEDIINRLKRATTHEQACNILYDGRNEEGETKHGKRRVNH
jgi:hypothetical protein